MKIKMYQILGVEEFFNKIQNHQIPLKTAYKIMKLIKILEPEKIFYQEKFQNIIEKYGEKDENNNLIFLEQNNGIKIKPELIDKCQLEMEELINLEVDICFEPFLIDELNSLQISIQELDTLFPFIKEVN